MATFPRFLPLALCAMASFAQAAQADPLRIELNALHPRDGACQLVFVAQNGTGADVSRLVLEAVLFGQQGQVAAMTLLDLQDLPADRMRVRSFEIGGLSCGDVSRLLINGLNECAPADSAACTAPLALESRVPVEVLQ
ncbi:hypothetical protein [Pararhodobacter zhoushanensis]|uniref:Tat pathway signal protein n=1 Tax=Pararhodobacter zhoushanensis TaxID=2479545 RepID=A0ABT3GX07_9RHOB|nr:hypothetical protein [Pararhodobacter zhoushanensis]MCW1932035.1 hypothetical protein [Pararhodobacter zhoushanensis]